ncbi:MAG: AMP-binding protein, partial [Terriglobus roseus]|nr:AMP-binding protein [Terriglobus roseus]
MAMLAVMKAGGASVAMDTTQPEERLRSIVQQTSPRVIVASRPNEGLARRLGADGDTNVVVVVLDESSVTRMPTAPLSRESVPPVRPANWLYVNFTSGSTGTPKGAIITHRNMSSAVSHQSAAMGFRLGCRVLDFASYAFDLAWYALVQTLCAGGCLCVPSEEERTTRTSQTMSTYEISIANLTPSTIATLDAKQLSRLESLIIGGEAFWIRDTDMVTIREDTKITNAYGPAECTPGATAAGIDLLEHDWTSIGYGLGLCTWVVDAAKADNLVPVGTVGELWLEGPLVGAGYLNDPDKTQAAFIEDPAWLLRGGPGHTGRRGRLYRTGDLVRYNDDGSLSFVGRKDTQVKLRGQRIELAEVEHHVRQAIYHAVGAQGPEAARGAGDAHVVAEVVTPQGHDRPMLVAFICSNQAEGSASQTGDDGWAAEVQQLTTRLDERLAEVVPAYMIPSAYIPLQRVPMTATGKTDRRVLRAVGSDLTPAQLAALRPRQEDSRQPQTPMERRLQQIWADTLHIEPQAISAGDSFFRLGGDSISAMRLVAAAREEGLSLTVADTFRSARLEDLARVVRLESVADVEAVPAFSLLADGTAAGDVCGEAARLCGLEIAQVEDVFPCTPLQEGLLALTVRRPGDYVRRSVHQLHPAVDTGRFCQAWEEIALRSAILRTRIADLPGHGLVQVVVKESLRWTARDVLEIYLREDEGQHMGLGSCLARFALVGNEGTEARFFVMTLHHALYDGWSLPMIMNAVYQVYHGRTPQPLLPFQAFVKHLQSVDEASALSFWTDEFAGSEV